MNAAPAILKEARRLVAAGISLVPVGLDGAKAPAFSVLPVDPETEAPVWSPFQERLPTDADLLRWYGNGRRLGLAAIGGAVSGNLEQIDFDSADRIEPFRHLVEEALPGLIGRLAWIETPRPGGRALYRCKEPVEGNLVLAQRLMPADEKHKDPWPKATIETRGEGGYAVLPGSPLQVHETGRPYRLIHGDLTQLPVITAAERQLLLNCARSLTEYLEPERIHRPRVEVTRSSDAGLLPGEDFNARGDVGSLLQSAGWTFCYQRGETEYWRRPGKKKGHSATLHHVAPNVLVSFSPNAAPLSGDNEGRGYDAFSVYALLKHRGDYSAAAKQLYTENYGDRKKRESTPLPGDADAPPERSLSSNGNRPHGAAGDSGEASAAAEGVTEAGALFPLTEEGSAERLIAQHGPVMRFCFGLKQWYLWDGKHWPPDETNQVEHSVVQMARAMLREAAAEDDTAAREALIKKSQAAESSRGMRAVLDLARKHVPVLPHQLDLDPYLISVNNGTIDLRTGQRRAHSPDDLITACLDLDYNPQATRTRFLRFLERIQPDPAVRQYLQEAMGYSLTGDASEQVFFFLFGCGRKPDGMPGDGHNGKTTFVELFTRLLARYAWKTDVNVFRNVEQEAEAARPQLAQLRGRRLVVCSEMPDDFEINEALVKDVTGLDTIPARDVYRSAINFRPTFKVWMYGNYKPVITGTNEGIRRRPKLIEFPTYILPEERDKHLGEKLWEEREGIFAWAVEGAIARHRRGFLMEPKAVTDATREYLEDMDPMGQYFQQRCEFGLTDEFRVSKEALYNDYKSWCWSRGEPAETDNKFGRRAKQLGLKPYRPHGVMIFRGVRLRPVSSDEHVHDLHDREGLG